RLISYITSLSCFFYVMFYLNQCLSLYYYIYIYIYIYIYTHIHIYIFILQSLRESSTAMEQNLGILLVRTMYLWLVAWPM
ncbi:MAG: hypothetical protein N7Q72_03350, partial [Spiroplasma sp. Tabriz.8]|nr:hypothetical protein [Spiroplasma sp. Tabriz.8]